MAAKPNLLCLKGSTHFRGKESWINTTIWLSQPNMMTMVTAAGGPDKHIESKVYINTKTKLKLPNTTLNTASFGYQTKHNSILIQASITAGPIKHYNRASFKK